MILSVLIAVTALLYASVGHGGASGYLAVMALMGLDAAAMKPAALSLNLFVAAIAWWRFARQGAFDRRLWLYLIFASMPAAFLGGLMTLPGLWYRPLIGVVLLLSAWRFLRRSPARPRWPSAPRLPALFGVGALLGFFSGLTGVGGGIYLSPLLIALGWADVRVTAGVSAAFIFSNSAAALTGLLAGGASLPDALPSWVVAAVVGGLLGSHLGSRRLGALGLRRMLAVVLAIAGIKMLLTT